MDIRDLLTPEQIAGIRVERHIPILRGELKRSEYDKDIHAFPRHGNRAKLLEFVDNPRFIIRRPEWTFFGLSKRKLITICTIAQRLFRELRQDYGIPVYVLFIVTENSDGEATFYGITPKVISVNVLELSGVERADAIADLKRVYEQLFTYYEDKIKSREVCLSEILDLEQFSYGTIEGHPKPRWYLVDTDPIFSKNRAFLRDMASELDIEIEPLEEICGATLPEFRKRFIALRRSAR